MLTMSSDLDALGWMVKRLQHRHHRALDTRLAKKGSSLVQWNALREIDRSPGLTQHALAEKTFNSDQAFGTLVTRLMARGDVERTTGEGRALKLSLTAKGRSVLRDGQKVMTEVLTTSFAPLSTKERAELGRLLVKLLDHEWDG
jgi:DNA-binding MarR family transcriptional regulator